MFIIENLNQVIRTSQGLDPSIDSQHCVFVFPSSWTRRRTLNKSPMNFQSSMGFFSNELGLFFCGGRDGGQDFGNNLWMCGISGRNKEGFRKNEDEEMMKRGGKWEKDSLFFLKVHGNICGDKYLIWFRGAFPFSLCLSKDVAFSSLFHSTGKIIATALYNQATFST